MAYLAEIEQETARRLGPYRRLTAAAGTPTTVVVDALRSTIDLGGWVGLHLLRRGELVAGPAVAVAVGDRVRRVKAYDPQTGTLTVDRAYADVAPVAGEAIEVHHLEPEHELRPAVLAGLRRCYFEERVEVTLAGAAAERNLTAAVPWITQRGQVRALQAADPTALVLPSTIQAGTPFERAGAVWVGLAPDPFPSRLLVSALRPATTLVNGVSSTAGPTLDGDQVAVGLDYAAAVCHMEAWRYWPHRLQPLADGRIYPTRDAVRSVKEQAVAVALGSVRSVAVVAARFAAVPA